MTTLILKLTTVPAFDGFRRVRKAFGDFVELTIEVKKMARDAEQRFPFVIE